ncbi:HlyD family efflux transporter periplasmic adaptor subunit [Lentilitoribacter sp. Alg239-R112]|uniref:efflux RND transporter periplasmic adaptor subunit n=1 Tax=Lentilitoribacter sp. Alg239-R112 TaxID=2305987 RepID=UPI0013A6F997|nr:HlyD family efflux transporter periplasmic adaptor subunit [Lentilitoribacter sp. Alg239-R112]
MKIESKGYFEQKPDPSPINSTKNQSDKVHGTVANTKTKGKFLTFGLLLTVLLSVVAWDYWNPNTSDLAMSQIDKTAPKVLEIEPQTISNDIVILGMIGADQIVPVVAPFDGVITNIYGQLGAAVTGGKVLLTLDTSEIEIQLREAEAETIRSRVALDLLKNWNSSGEVLRVQRSLKTAELLLLSLETKTTELAELFKRGIVSRNEYNGLIEQRDRQKFTVLDQQLDLERILARANKENTRLAELTFQNAQSRHIQLNNQKNRASITAEKSGILTRAPSLNNSALATPTIEPGVRVASGQALYAIADATTLIVSSTIDEVDVHKIRMGQKVTIESDAFQNKSFIGEIVSISAEAIETGSSSSVPVFEVRARFSPSNEIKSGVVRLGMSARMTIEIYKNPDAIIVPISSIHYIADEPFVGVKDKITNNIEYVPVELGQTTLDGIEVSAGLKSGDLIFIQ